MSNIEVPLLFTFGVGDYCMHAAVCFSLEDASFKYTLRYRKSDEYIDGAEVPPRVLDLFERVIIALEKDEELLHTRVDANFFSDFEPLKIVRNDEL